MHPSPRNGNPPKSIFEELDRRAKALNAFPVALATRLAALGAACFAALKLSAIYSGFETRAGYSAGTGTGRSGFCLCGLLGEWPGLEPRRRACTDVPRPVEIDGERLNRRGCG